MISISTNVKDFWCNKDSASLLFLYGAGTNAEAAVELINKAGIKIEGFIDSNRAKEFHYFNKYQIFTPEYIKNTYKT